MRNHKICFENKVPRSTPTKQRLFSLSHETSTSEYIPLTTSESNSFGLSLRLLFFPSPDCPVVLDSSYRNGRKFVSLLERNLDAMLKLVLVVSPFESLSGYKSSFFLRGLKVKDMSKKNSFYSNIVNPKFKFSKTKLDKRWFLASGILLACLKW